MSHVQHSHCNNRGYQEYNIKPPMIKVEMNVPQHLCDNDPEVRRQVHPHQQNTRNKVHSHYLSQEQDEKVAGFGAGDSVEPFDEVDEEAPD